MHKRTFVIVLGVLIALIPFLGFPGRWENLFVMIAGIAIILLSIDWSFLIRKKKPKGRKRIVANDVFVEHTPIKPAEEFRSGQGV